MIWWNRSSASMNSVTRRWGKKGSVTASRTGVWIFLIKKEVDAMHDNLQDLSADLNSSKAK